MRVRINCAIVDVFNGAYSLPPVGYKLVRACYYSLLFKSYKWVRAQGIQRSQELAVYQEKKHRKHNSLTNLSVKWKSRSLKRVQEDRRT